VAERFGMDLRVERAAQLVGRDDVAAFVADVGCCLGDRVQHLVDDGLETSP